MILFSRFSGVARIAIGFVILSLVYLRLLVTICGNAFVFSFGFVFEAPPDIFGASALSATLAPIRWTQSPLNMPLKLTRCLLDSDFHFGLRQEGVANLETMGMRFSKKRRIRLLNLHTLNFKFLGEKLKIHSFWEL